MRRKHERLRRFNPSTITVFDESSVLPASGFRVGGRVQPIGPAGKGSGPTVTVRDAMTWKYWFYEVWLPRLARIPSDRAARGLDRLGRLLAVWPGRFAQTLDQVRRVRLALNVEWDDRQVTQRLLEGLPRFHARDYLLDHCDLNQLDQLFDVEGWEPVARLMESGTGVVLLGSHLGAHLCGVHWLLRRRDAIRLLVQRPCHVSSFLNEVFDRCGDLPQREFFLKRGLPPALAIERVMTARSALRKGMSIYLNGDIPWYGPNTRVGRLLGQPHRLISLWADLAAVARAPVVTMFCGYRPGGRHRLVFDPPRTILPGQESQAVRDYLIRLELEIARYPHEAVAHLLWPCFGPPREASSSTASACNPASTPSSSTPPLSWPAQAGEAGTDQEPAPGGLPVVPRPHSAVVTAAGAATLTDDLPCRPSASVRLEMTCKSAEPFNP
ncbi:hypothetical protein Isop_0181 [Isosphaera pallida ATCC 43644]|jgi:lauroyl/myristoyl acyltransferase|uniref:Lipid A biosynthesis acyltransferase n=1 Tax=Isosphaera pallida (strain ATCC 43644 / DSM 9630 / IS1B) TaxID=575540 RepID=E8R683_ISOPI|nr:hypothetical protein Isop_0181 [Isosphaera pallida ATCC 43644]